MPKNMICAAHECFLALIGPVLLGKLGPVMGCGGRTPGLGKAPVTGIGAERWHMFDIFGRHSCLPEINLQV